MSLSIEKKEEDILPSSISSPTPLPKHKNKIWVVIICFIVFRSTYLHFWHPTDKSPWTPSNNCPQADILIPEKNGKIWTEQNVKIGSAAFEKIAIDWLAGAIRIP
jgi:Gly-Xaa carboxypeptidase